MSVRLTCMGLNVLPRKPFKLHGICESGAILICCPNLQPGEYRICSIMPADRISLDWQLACIVENFEAPLVVERSTTGSDGTAVSALRRRGGSLNL